jgi:hypothetical protein
MSPIADMDAHQAVFAAALAPESNNFAQRLSYSSWRRHQTPVSLRPFGARSSH